MTISSKKRKEREYRALIRDVFVCSKTELAPFATAFFFPPENFEQQKFGTLFGVIKVNDHSENSSYVVNLLTSVIKKEYFGKPHRNAEESFEAGMRKANLALAELARHGITSWTGKINFAGGAIERNNLHFACLGNSSIFLVRRNEIAEINEKLEEEKSAEPHPLKTFSNVSSGKLEIGDKIILTTNELLDIFSPEELRQNATHFSREEFPGFLEISLRANSELAGTIVIDMTEAAEAKPLIVEAPIIGKEKLKKVDSFVGTWKMAEKEPPVPLSELAAPQEISGPTPRWKKILIRLKNIAPKIGNGLKIFFSKTGKFMRGMRLGEKFSRLFSFLLNTISRTKDINWKDKKVLARAAVTVVVLAVGIYGVVAFVRNRNEKKLAEETTVQPIQPAPAPQSLDDINVKNIEVIEEVANLSQENIDLAFLDNALYAISGKDKNVTKINLDSKATEEMKSDISSGNFGLLTAMPHLKTLFALTEDRKIIAFTPVNKNFQENSISLPANLKARDIKSYLTYLYVLDIGSNQVYRYPRAEGGFGEGQSWLRAAADLKNAKGIAINGDLYLAESEKITAYLQGKFDESISFENPNIPLSIDKIFSDPDMEGVYVLDNKNRRIVEFSKDGKIINQHFNADIVSIKDFSVDEKNKIIYLLKDNQLLKFSVE